jgi:hypothetical protein
MFGFILPFVIKSSAQIFSTFIFAEFESSARNEGKFVLCQMLMGICLYKSELNQIGIFSDFLWFKTGHCTPRYIIIAIDVQLSTE